MKPIKFTYSDNNETEFSKSGEMSEITRSKQAYSSGSCNLNQKFSLKIANRCLLFLAALAVIAPSVRAQSYSIDWFTIDGGGGTSTGGVYQVSGTIGQPDAGKMSGGSYTLDGGFWGIIAAVQTPGAPVLRVQITATNTVLIAWPAAASGFSLQQNTAVGSTNWIGVTNIPVISGGENQVIVPSQPGSKFYRLKYP
jgi:hypothetical protein